ncbi:hypothetical protein DC498_03010 [Terrimonas sp.]|uniref:hypothetical protein n=1 Tax=Terrimonas sp. TaxID=1914338 RepID=UPI000D50ED25|nr:hypothetical protein [Terrimonas sp.]PVD53503.1 hypothetical protein DC498_03010 [Terrimonas sp.]
MRKIDAVLLSALIIYDYSAQSLVNSDTISLGHSFVSSALTEDRLANTDFSFTPDFTNSSAMVRGARKISPEDINEKDISFHELAKVNPVTASVALNNINVEDADVAINIVMPADAEIDAPETFSVEEASVNTSVTDYAAAVSSTEKINVQVATEADLSTFDADNDGTYDVEDKCPGVAGVARFEGCPVPDSDADGINDEEDRCPLEKGTDGNYGCPVAVSETVITEPAAQTEIAAETEVTAIKNNQFIFTVGFNKENKILSSEDFNIVLRLTDILVRTPDAKVEIEGVINANTTLPQTPVELLGNYFKDLGVSENQIIVKKQTREVKQANEGISKVEMRIKL